MSVESDIIRFIQGSPSAWFCDGCLALAVKVSLNDARAAIAELEPGRRIERRAERCSRCRRSINATRFAAGAL